jgi:membrane fusion protein, heavy metal efflux system
MSESVNGGAPFRVSWLLLVLVGAGVGVVGDRLVASGERSAAADKPPAAAPATSEAFTRVGNRIVVPPNSSLRARLDIAQPVLREASRTLVLPALVEADPARTVKVLPPVAGRVTELKTQLGSRVMTGDLLAVIDSSDLAQAYADDEKAQAAFTLTKQSLDRMMVLERTAAISVRDRQQAQSDYAQAEAELARSQNRLRAIGVSADQKDKSRLLFLKAPVSGSVIDLQIAPGAFVNDPTVAIMTIANLETIWVTANVPEKDTAFVFNNQPVNVEFPAYPGKLYQGKVLFVSDVLEPDTRRTKVRIAFDNPDRELKPNMFANATFVAPSEMRIMVPNSALLMNNDRTSVFVEVADWAFERRDVELAYQEGTVSAIKSGLGPGDRVVVKGGVRLND